STLQNEWSCYNVASRDVFDLATLARAALRVCDSKSAIDVGTRSGGVDQVMNIDKICDELKYFPWLGYFSKMLQADVFIFLDDAQYTKNSYINRVQVLCNGLAKWLTIPVRVPLGTAIRDAAPSAEWVEAH